MLCLGVMDAVEFGDAHARLVIDVLSDIAGAVIQTALEKRVNVLPSAFSRSIVRCCLHIHDQFFRKRLRIGHAENRVIKTNLIIKQLVTPARQNFLKFSQNGLFLKHSPTPLTSPCAHHRQFSTHFL